MYSHPYSQITVETEFDNPIYETGVSWSLFPPSLSALNSLTPKQVAFPFAHETTGRKSWQVVLSRPHGDPH